SAEDEPDLLLEVVAEEARPRDRRGKNAGPGDMTIGQARIDLGEGRRLDANLRVGRADVAAQAPFFQELCEAVADEFGMPVIDMLEARDGGLGVVETFRRDRRRS